VNTLERIEDQKAMGLNEIGRVTIKMAQPLVYDSYNQNRLTGSLVLVDETTNETLAAGMIV